MQSDPKTCPACVFFGTVYDPVFQGLGWCAKHAVYLAEEVAEECADYVRRSAPRKTSAKETRNSCTTRPNDTSTN